MFPLFYKLGHAYLFCFGTPFFFVMIYNSFACFFKDPGIIPRNHVKFKLEKNIPKRVLPLSIKDSTDKLQKVDISTDKVENEKEIEIKPKVKKKINILFPYFPELSEENYEDENVMDEKMLERGQVSFDKG